LQLHEVCVIVCVVRDGSGGVESNKEKVDEETRVQRQQEEEQR
jgi:hypothetical protein